MKKQTLYLLLAFITTHAFSQIRNTCPGTWVATDELERSLYINEDVGDVKQDKTVGMFYYIWHNETGAIHDISKILSGQEEWGGPWSFHHYAESLFGYYSSKDEFVIRKHMQMIVDAGVDFIYFDVTNDILYLETQIEFFEVLLRIKENGGKVPYIAMQFGTAQRNNSIETFYNQLATDERYKELFFKYNGKPLMLANYTGTNQEIKDYFTFKYSWAMTTQPWYTSREGKDCWAWLDFYPQKPGYGSNGELEQTSVATAHFSHGIYALGKSTGADYTQAPNYNTNGTFFQLQWDRAHDIDPPIVMVSQWNEWIAQRFIKGDPTYDYPVPISHMAREPITTGSSIFIDVYSPEYSRDIEPLRTAYRDNIYMQLVNNIRKYKGVQPMPTHNTPSDITITTDFSAWDGVSAVFYDDKGDTFHRDHVSFGSDLTYSNTTGRNDIIESKVAFDANNIYFYVKTASPLSPHTDNQWLNLLIDSDCDHSTGWNGFDLIANHSIISEGTTSLKQNTDASTFSWGNASNINYQYSGNEMHLSIPAALLNINTSNPFSFDFKWVDNSISSDDILDVYVDGDAAPNNRFNYRFKSEGIKYRNPWHFDASTEGWNPIHNLNISANNSICTVEVTGSDPYMLSPSNIDLNASDYQYLIVKMKNNTASNGAQLYWTTNSENYFDQDKYKLIPMMPTDNQFRTYVVDLSSDPDWQGTIKRIRIDPTGSSAGTVEIDYIKLTGTYNGLPYTIPCTIEAENYNIGGQNNGYHDYEMVNKGNANSTDAVDVTQNGESKYISQTQAEEWLEYIIKVDETGEYTIKSYVSAISPTSTIQYFLDGTSLTPALICPVTEDEQDFTEISSNVYLPQGTHVLRLLFPTDGATINKFAISRPKKECQVNLITNSHTCDNIGEITFKNTPFNSQTVFSIDLNPELTEYNSIALGIDINQNHSGWLINIGDSETNDGFGGDAGTQNNDSEFQLLNYSGRIYGSDYTPADQVIDGNRLLYENNNLLNGNTSLNISLANNTLNYSTANSGETYQSPYIFALDGQADNSSGGVNYSTWFSFNRSINNSSRTGNGVENVTITLDYIPQNLKSHQNLADLAGSNSFCDSVCTTPLRPSRGIADISPNPFTDHIDITYKEDSDQPSTYQISDMRGRVVTAGSILEGRESILLGFLAKGTYLMMLYQENKLVYKSIIIKN